MRASLSSAVSAAQAAQQEAELERDRAAGLERQLHEAEEARAVAEDALLRGQEDRARAGGDTTVAAGGAVRTTPSGASQQQGTSVAVKVRGRRGGVGRPLGVSGSMPFVLRQGRANGCCASWWVTEVS